jgi:DNA invertase Pin-like site-specific DNA recombinase
MHPEKMALVVLRVSTPEQLKGFSIETQKQYCLERAQEQQLSVPNDGIYVRDETGTTLERADIQHALDRLRRGEAKHLIIFALDRLTRAPEDFLPLRRELHRYGIVIHVALEKRVLSEDPLEQLPDDIRVLFAKMERAMFLRRSKEGRATKIASGRVPGNGPPPYGFSYIGHKHDRQLVINEDEADIIRMIAQWFLRGDGGLPLSTRGITRRLTELCIPTRADTLGRAKRLHKYGEWDIAMVAAILRDASIAGTFYANRYERVGKTGVRLRPREAWIPIAIPPILDQDTFNAIQRKLDAGRQLSKRNTRRLYLLRCRVRCSCGYAVCGYPNRSGTLGYRCLGRNRTRYPHSTCQMPSIPADLLETRVWDWLEHEALDDRQLQARIAREQARTRTERGAESVAARRTNLEAKLAANAAAEQQLLTEAIRKRFSEAAIDTEQRRIFAEREDLHRRLTALGAPEPPLPLLSDAAASDLRTYAAVIREGLTEMSPDEQRHAMDMLDMRLLMQLEDGAVIAEATCALRLESARLWIDKRTQTG